MKMLCPEEKHEVKIRFNPSAGERFCPDHGCPLVPLPKAQRSKSREGLPGEKQARSKFIQTVKAKPCFFLDCDEFGERRRPDHKCTYPLDAHHLIPKGWAKRELSLPPEEMVELIWNPLIGAPLCRAAHHQVEMGAAYIYWGELNPDLIAFCERFDAEHPDERSLLERLKIESPPKSTSQPNEEGEGA